MPEALHDPIPSLPVAGAESQAGTSAGSSLWRALTGPKGNGRSAAGMRTRTVESIKALVPVRPGPLLDLMNCQQDDPDKVARIIERDPALSARVLGVCNSAGGGALHGIKSVSRAVLHLGASRTRSLGLAFGMQMMAEGLKLPPDLLQQFWSCCIHKAEASLLAAEAMQVRSRGEAYTLGLLQDIGIASLMAIDPVFYSEHMPSRPLSDQWLRAERERFGMDHAEAGAILLEAWGVGKPICDLVRGHHQLPTHEDLVRLDETSHGTGTPDSEFERMPSFLAGLLPHDASELMSPAELDQLITLHSRFLSHRFATPDAYLQELAQRASQRLNTPSDEASKRQAMPVQAYFDAIAENTIQLIHQLWELQDATARSMNALSEMRLDACSDPLTKVLNRRGFFQLVQQRIQRAGSGASCCCALLDLNKFKPINDTHGHDAGDLMLRGVAKLLRMATGKNDIIGRLGGDEFALFFCQLDENEARLRAEQLAKTLEGKKIRINQDLTLPVSCSLGVVYTARVKGPASFDALLNTADQLMYERKRSGAVGHLFRVLPPDTV